MSVNSIVLSDCEVIDQINLLQTQKPLGWQEHAVKILKQSWDYNLEMDLERVQKYNLVSQQLLEKIKFAVSREKVPYWIEYFEGKSFKEIYQICFLCFGTFLSCQRSLGRRFVVLLLN